MPRPFTGDYAVKLASALQKIRTAKQLRKRESSNLPVSIEETLDNGDTDTESGSENVLPVEAIEEQPTVVASEKSSSAKMKATAKTRSNPSAKQKSGSGVKQGTSSHRVLRRRHPDPTAHQSQPDKTSARKKSSDSPLRRRVSKSFHYTASGIFNRKRQFICSDCRKIFMASSALSYHKRREHLQKFYLCTCGIQFGYIHNLHRHVKRMKDLANHSVALETPEPDSENDDCLESSESVQNFENGSVADSDGVDHDERDDESNSSDNDGSANDESDGGTGIQNPHDLQKTTEKDGTPADLFEGDDFGQEISGTISIDGFRHGNDFMGSNDSKRMTEAVQWSKNELADMAGNFTKDNEANENISSNSGTTSSECLVSCQPHSSSSMEEKELQLSPCKEANGTVDTPIRLVEGETVERIHVDEITTEKFTDLFDRPLKPVVILGCTDNWPAKHFWTPEQLTEKYGDVEFVCTTVKAGKQVKIKMKEYVANMNQTTEQNPLYILDHEFGEQKDKMLLLKDYKVPHLFSEDICEFIPDEWRPAYRWFLMGPADSGTGIHVDPYGSSAWNTVLFGTKRWCFLPPNTPKNFIGLGKKSDQAKTWFKEIYPKTKLSNWPSEYKPLEIVQGPGDTVYVPAGWWHVVLNQTTTVAVTQNFCSRANFASAWKATVEQDSTIADVWLEELKKREPALAKEAEELASLPSEPYLKRKRKRKRRPRETEKVATA